MIELVQAARQLQDFCTAQQWQSCFIGGFAVQRWGEPRFTSDIDLSLLTGFGKEEAFVDGLLARFRPRTEGQREFALRSRVLLLTADNEVPMDIALAALPFEEGVIARASPFEYERGGPALTTCSAEDLIIYKAFADRALDWHDVETILVRQGDKLDFAYIYRELAPLCALKEAPEIVPRLQALGEKIAAETTG